MLKRAQVGQGMEREQHPARGGVGKGKAQLEYDVKDNKRSFHQCDSSKTR